MFVRYNRELAVKYATDWAQDRNPNYKDYEKWGGDCTNFVSQCLHEGGIPFDHHGNDILKQWYGQPPSLFTNTSQKTTQKTPKTLGYMLWKYHITNCK